MATTTTNFGWDIPQSTDLVKDGATAIAALGQDIDTALVDLKGGTTGQVLSKASGTDLDFTWVTDAAGDITGVTAGTGISGGGTSGTVTVTNSMATAIDAKGDLIGGTGADTFSRLAVGANGTVLTADSAQATGLKWATAGGGGLVFLSSTSFSAVTAVSLPNNSFSSTYDDYRIIFRITSVSADSDLRQRYRASGTDDTSSLYYSGALVVGNAVGANYITSGAATSSAIAILTSSIGSTFKYGMDIFSPFSSNTTNLTYQGWSDRTGRGDSGGVMGSALFNNTTSFDSMTFTVSTGTITGEWRLYGYAKA